MWVMNADGTGAHEILTNETLAAVGHIRGLAWSPRGDRIAIANDMAIANDASIYTVAPDGSGFIEVAGGTEPHWSPDGSQLAYAGLGGCTLRIADADGSNVREVDGCALSGPWHP
jgi:Tol biopolymer transport system component